MTTEAEAREETFTALNKEIEELKNANSELRRLELERTLLASMTAPEQQARRVRQLAKFAFSDGQFMTCPVPMMNGNLIQLLDVYECWKLNACCNEGTYFAGFTCPYTGVLTSLASPEMVSLIHRMASDLELSNEPPFRFLYPSDGGGVLDFNIVDQILLASVCCKVYRSGAATCTERVFIPSVSVFFTVSVVDNVAEFTACQVRASSESRTMRCMFDGLAAFFERWKIKDD